MKYKSAMMTQASGSVGGMTASRNRGGNYIRARAIPTNPNTSFQIEVRTFFAQLTALWSSTLTAAQRTAWELYAANVPLINSLGDAITVSGLNMYLRTNVPRLQASGARIDAAPIVFDLGAFTPIALGTLDSTAGTIDFTIDNTDAWANDDAAQMLIYVGKPVQASINYFSGPYRLSAAVLGNATTAPLNAQTVTPVYGVVDGLKSFVRCRVIQGDGRLSTIQELNGIGAP